jgi:hypothetical protein
MESENSLKNSGVRRYPRLSAKHLISYEYFDDENTEDIEGLGISQNLSIGGLLIEIDKNVRPGATLILEIALKEHMIRATGKVVHCTQGKPAGSSGFEVGVAFTQINKTDVDLLANYFKEKGIPLKIDPR